MSAVTATVRDRTAVVKDGADRDVIEYRVTHTRAKRSASDGYARGKRWAETCAEIAKLKIRRKPAPRLAIVVASDE
jgi:hypothetical protein